jgi:HD-like signal output (HDOD) protein
MNIDRRKVLHAARNSIPLVVVTHTLPAQTQTELEDILLLFSNELGQASLHDPLTYCLRELTGNAKKANTKRVYFEERGLRLDDPEHYEKGMRSFKVDTLSDINRYLALQQQKNLTIKVAYLIRDHVLYLSVRNSASITNRELTRVFDRVERSRAFDSMAEAFDEVLDDTEGAGLGIVILVLMLKKMGLSEKSFDLKLIGNETAASLAIPMRAALKDEVSGVTDELVAAIETIPPFPENLQQLIKLLDDPEVKMAALADQLGRDPAMTADLMKYLNSAGVGRRRTIASLDEAVKIVGIRGLKDLTYSFGAHQLLGRFLAEQKHLWDYATRVSYYALALVHEIRGDRTALSWAQLGGILSNLGQIILSYLHPEQNARILEFCRAKGFSIEAFEALTNAVNPAEVGARIAEKWEFPKELVLILRFQHAPASAPAALQPVLCAVHLAASLVALEQDLLPESQLNQSVLKALSLTEPERLQAFHTRVREAFELRA